MTAPLINPTPRPVPSEADAARMAALLRAAGWTYAKTMPENPHEYTLRRAWPAADFEWAVLFIRQFGYAEWWPNMVVGRAYVAVDVDGYHYWTMGDTLARTILINRKPCGPPA